MVLYLRKIVLSISLFISVISFVYCENTFKYDDYVNIEKIQCLNEKVIFSCLKYRLARFIWSVANGQTNLFSNNKVDPANKLITIVKLEENETTEPDYNISSDSRAISGKYVNLKY